MEGEDQRDQRDSAKVSSNSGFKTNPKSSVKSSHINSFAINNSVSNISNMNNMSSNTQNTQVVSSISSVRNASSNVNTSRPAVLIGNVNSSLNNHSNNGRVSLNINKSAYSSVPKKK